MGTDKSKTERPLRWAGGRGGKAMIEEPASFEERQREEQGRNAPSHVQQASPAVWTWPEPTVLTLQDFLDLPKQMLPEQTYHHLQNAVRETALTFYSLWRSLDRAAKGGKGGSTSRVRRRIDVE